MDTHNVLIAFSMTLIAGLATGIGSALAFFAKETNTKFLSVALGFSAGVMLYVSFVEILAKARSAMAESMGDVTAAWIAVASFFGGMLIIGLIDKFVPSYENPHEMHVVEEMDDKTQAKKVNKLFHMGLLSALAIGIHNFPEGLATFSAALKDPQLGLPITVAIAIHNIPEGIAVSIPIFYATGSRRKAFAYSFLSGVSEPVGALVGYGLLMYLFRFNDMMFGILFAGVAGIMVFISLDQLLPTAREYGEHHLSIWGLVSGMVVMAVSLLLFL